MEYVVLAIIVTILLAFIPSSIAGKKGYSSVGFFLFGLAAFVPALIVALCLGDKVALSQRESMLQNELRSIRNDLVIAKSGAGMTATDTHKEKPENPLIRRAYLSMEDNEWDKADELLELALNSEPENAKAYIGKLCVQLRIAHEKDLSSLGSSLNEYNQYRRALQFADQKYKETLELYVLPPNERYERYDKMINRVNSVVDRKDPKECRQLVADLEQLDDQDSLQFLRQLGTPIKISSDKITCYLCGETQQINRRICWKCGISFIE